MIYMLQEFSLSTKTILQRIWAWPSASQHIQLPYHILVLLSDLHILAPSNKYCNSGDWRVSSLAASVHPVYELNNIRISSSNSHHYCLCWRLAIYYLLLVTSSWKLFMRKLAGSIQHTDDNYRVRNKNCNIALVCLQCENSNFDCSKKFLLIFRNKSCRQHS